MTGNLYRPGAWAWLKCRLLSAARGRRRRLADSGDQDLAATLAELTRQDTSELARLAAGLDDLGITLDPAAEVAEAAVTTALQELELAQRRAGKAFERGPLPEAVYEASVARYDEAVNAELRNPPGSILGDEGRRFLAQHPAYRAGVEGAVDAALGRAADGLRLLVELDQDAAGTCPCQKRGRR